VTSVDETATISLAVQVRDPALADRLVELLTDVPGLRLVPGGDDAEVVLVSSAPAAEP